MIAIIMCAKRSVIANIIAIASATVMMALVTHGCHYHCRYITTKRSMIAIIIAVVYLYPQDAFGSNPLSLAMIWQS